jgi:hypothetical protein
MNRCPWVHGAAAALLAHSLAASAAPASSDEFAWRAPLEVPANASLVRVDVPASALARLRSAEARDVRVFNAKGESAPFAWLGSAEPARPAEEKTESFPALPLYTAPASKAPAKGTMEVRIGDRANGRSVWMRLDGASDPGSRLNSAIFMTRAERRPLAAIDVQATLPANRPVRMAVSTSPDLANWSPVSVRGRLYRFDGPGAPTNTRLEFDAPLQLEKLYLRLDWDDGVAVASISGAVARASAPRRVAVALPAARAVAPDTLEITTGFATPIAALALTLAPDNMLVPVRVLGRSEESQPWRVLGHTAVYRLSEGGAVTSNPPLELHGASAQALRIVSTNGAALAPLQLAAGAEFIPRQLIFVTSGPGPFTLAAGRERTEAAALPAATFTGTLGARKIEDIPLAGVGTPAQSSPRAGWLDWIPGAPGKIAVLWSVLAAGVLMLAGVAWSLMRQMKGGPPHA